MHRPLARAQRLASPLWVGACESDVSVSARALERLVERASAAELRRYPGDHFAPFLAAEPQRIAADQLDFLRRGGLLGEPPAVAPGASFEEVSRG